MPETHSPGPHASRRDRRRQETVDDIKGAARRQLARGGTAAISLRAIARELEITASAVHYYFPSRQALIDSLILDGYHSLAHALRTAHHPTTNRPPAQQWIAVCQGHRSWALRHAEQYLLLYGHDGAAAARRRNAEIHKAMSSVTDVLFAVMRNAVATGEIDTDRIAAITTTSFRGELANWRAAEGTVETLPDGALAACITLYAHLHGAITLELLGHVPPQLTDRAALFDLEMTHAFASLRAV